MSRSIAAHQRRWQALAFLHSKTPVVAANNTKAGRFYVRRPLVKYQLLSHITVRLYFYKLKWWIGMKIAAQSDFHKMAYRIP
jgi:hypothetical protein